MNKLVLHTEKQESDRLGLSVRTLQKMRITGDGPPFLKIHRSVRYRPDLTDEWLASRVRTSTSEVAA